MAATPQNLLVLMSDEHNPKIAGYAGHPIISTPALDTLAARGSRFTAAYTPSPICVPARASLATGLPVHRHRAWDNAIAYDGRIQSWAHALRNRGHHVASIGKLHYRGHPEDDYGLIESLLAMHITGSVGDLTHLVRDPDDIRTTGKNLIASAGPGESSYTWYNRQVAAAAQAWLRETGRRRHSRPSVLFVSMVAPHFPLTAPPEHFIAISARSCRGRSSTISLSGRTMPISACTHGDRITIHTSVARAPWGVGRLFRPRIVSRRADRQYSGCVVRNRPRRHNACDLHLGSGRQSRRPWPLGQGDDVRGERRHPYAGRGRRRADWSRLRHAGHAV
jgi:hypothetical protein